jgi:hypothetical protein
MTDRSNGSRSNSTPFESNLFHVKQHFVPRETTFSYTNKVLFCFARSSAGVSKRNCRRVDICMPTSCEIVGASFRSVVDVSTFCAIVGASTSRSNDGPAQKTDLQFRIA